MGQISDAEKLLERMQAHLTKMEHEIDRLTVACVLVKDDIAHVKEHGVTFELKATYSEPANCPDNPGACECAPGTGCKA